jgi:predicted nuclease with TOPRIM domain
MVKGVTELSGLRNIRGMRSCISMTSAQGSGYLELYMLHKEKDRLEKEVQVLEKRKESNQKRIVEIKAEMERLEKEEAMGRQASPEGIKKPSEKEWKTMSLKY